MKPTLWVKLITEMQGFEKESRWGLAETWRLVVDGDYEAARARFDRLVAEREAERA